MALHNFRSSSTCGEPPRGEDLAVLPAERDERLDFLIDASSSFAKAKGETI
jgi:hypothetical protein